MRAPSSRPRAGKLEASNPPCAHMLLINSAAPVGALGTTPLPACTLLCACRRRVDPHVLTSLAPTGIASDPN